LSLQSRKRAYREKRDLATYDPEIGCIALTTPFFFEERDWIPAPEDWANNIVQGKTYESLEGSGS
jgi:putative restriction endonuclease